MSIKIVHDFLEPECDQAGVCSDCAFPTTVNCSSLKSSSFFCCPAVLHPVTRIDMPLRLFVDRATVKPLSIEREVAIGRIRDELEQSAPAMRLRLERVVVRRQRMEPDWRFPSIEPGRNDAVAVAPRVDVGLDFTTGEAHDIPIRIGSVFDLPWTASSPCLNGDSQSSSVRHLYRLVLIPCHGGSSRSEPNDDEYLLAQDIPGLLQTLSPARQVLPESATIQSLASSDLLESLCPVVKSSLSLLSDWQSTAPSSALVCGEIGSGKTYTALLLSAAAQLVHQRSTCYLDCRRLKNAQGMRLKGIMDEFLDVFQLAKESAPARIILDDLDELLPHIDAGPSTGNPTVQSHNPALVDQCHALAGLLRYLLRSILDAHVDVEIVFTGRDPETLAAAVRSDLPFMNIVKLPCLVEEERIILFCSFLDRLSAQHDAIKPQVCHVIASTAGFAQKTSGYKPLDLLQLAERYHQAFHRNRSTDTLQLLEGVLREYVPLNQRTASIETFQHEYSLQDVGGLSAVKEELVSTILRPAKYRRIYQHAQLRLPRGVLLFGPPGCGKSYVVPALARDCGYPTILCRGAEIVDKYIGASEMKVRELFSRAASVAPSILWIDELDALAPRRGSDSTGVTDRIVNQLLTFLDGVEDASISGTVYVVATSSRPDKVDPALLRPGRLERHVYVGLAEDDAEFTDVLVKLSARFHLSADLMDDLQSGRFLVSLKEQVPAFLEFSPADARSAFVSAQIAAAHAAIEKGEGGAGLNQVPCVSSDQLLVAFRSTKPSLSTKDRAMLDAIYAGFRKRPSLVSGSKSPPPNELKVALL